MKLIMALLLLFTTRVRYFLKKNESSSVLLSIIATKFEVSKTYNLSLPRSLFQKKKKKKKTKKKNKKCNKMNNIKYPIQNRQKHKVFNYPPGDLLR